MSQDSTHEGLISSFPAIATPNIRSLILGTMPSVASLRAGRYYAHPRNQFWPILADVFNFENHSYDTSCAELSRRNVGVWDVLKHCVRTGSLDSAIDPSTVQTNDFHTFLNEHPIVSHIYFNGAKAEQLFYRHVLPDLNVDGINLHRLPSTSPANAMMTKQQKLQQWCRIQTDLVSSAG